MVEPLYLNYSQELLFRLHYIQHRGWMFGGYLEQHASGTFWNAPALLPIAQCPHADAQQGSILLLGQSKTIANILDLRRLNRKSPGSKLVTA